MIYDLEVLTRTKWITLTLKMVTGKLKLFFYDRAGICQFCICYQYLNTPHYKTVFRFDTFNERMRNVRFNAAIDQ